MGGCRSSKGSRQEILSPRFGCRGVCDEAEVHSVSCLGHPPGFWNPGFLALSLVGGHGRIGRKGFTHCNPHGFPAANQWAGCPGGSSECQYRTTKKDSQGESFQTGAYGGGRETGL